MDLFKTLMANLKRSKHWDVIRRLSVVLLAALVASGVFWQLRFIGITMTDDQTLYCNKEAHEHTEDCVKKELKCGLQEGEPESGSDSASAGNSNGHHHTDECYVYKYDCGKEVHKHTAECFSDKSADIETAQVWEKDLPKELTGNYAKDLAAVAKSQVGYAESTKNFEADRIDENNYNLRGYTRYGAWSGEDFAYTDEWSSLFAAFCLYYAGVPENDTLSNIGAAAMLEKWNSKGLYLAGDADSVDPKVGDVVFLSKEKSGPAEKTGIVTEVNTDAKTFKVVIGNDDGQVKEVEFPTDSKYEILGFGRLPAQETAPAEKTDEETSPAQNEPKQSEQQTPAAEEQSADQQKTAEKADESAAQEAKETSREETKSSTKTEEAAESKTAESEKSAADKSSTAAQSATSSEIDAGSVVEQPNIFKSMVRSLFGSPAAMTAQADVPAAQANQTEYLTGYLTAVAGSGSVYEDPGMIQTNLRFDFTVPTSKAEQMTPGGTFVLPLKAGTYVSPILVAQGWMTAHDDRTGEPAFNYRFVQDGTDTYHVEIEFVESYVQSAHGSEDIDCYLKFQCKIEESSSEESDKIKITYSDSVILTINPDDILNYYDLTVKKTNNNYNFDQGDKIEYTVEVSSTHGTADVVNFTDTITNHGDGTLVKPEPANIKVYNQDGTLVSCSPAVTKVSDSPESYKIEINNLPQLGKNQSYRVVYEYELNNYPENPEINVGNYVSAVSGQITQGSGSSVYKQKKTEITKSGTVSDSAPNRVKWTININDAEIDVSGKEVTDDMFKDAVGGISITPNTGYEFVYNGSNQITGIRFTGSENRNKYTIVYETPADTTIGSSFDVTNTATFNGKSQPARAVGDVGQLFKMVELSRDDGDTIDIKWDLIVTCQNGWIEADTLFEDDFGPGLYMTEAQWSDLVTTLNTAWNNKIKDITPKTNSENKIIGYSFKASENIYNLSLALWSYWTTGVKSEAQGSRFTNTFKVKNKEVTEVHKFSNGKVRKLSLDANNQFNDSAGTSALNYDDQRSFGWAIEITPDIVDSHAKYNVYQFEDSLPKGFVVDYLAITNVNEGLKPDILTNPTESGVSLGTIPANGGAFSFTIGTLNAPISGNYILDPNGDTLSFSVDMSSHYWWFNTQKFYVYVIGHLSEDQWPATGQTVTHTYGNHIEVSTTDGEYGEADNTITVEASKDQHNIRKGGSWNQSGKTVDYTLDINPDKLALSPETEFIDFKDELAYTAKSGNKTCKFILVMDSVKVYEETEPGVWSEVTVWWKASTETSGGPQDWERQAKAIIEMKLPDQKHLKVQYSYVPDSELDVDLNIKNTATLNGVFESSGQDTTHISKEDASSHGGAVFELLQIKKIAQFTAEALHGAKFTVYKYENGQWTEVKDSGQNSKVYISDNQGIIEINYDDKLPDQSQLYEKNTAYKIVETEAPAGYVLPGPTEPQNEVLYWFSNNATEPTEAPEGFVAEAYDVSTERSRVPVENIKTEEVELPETGGSGTILYWTAGILFIGLSLLFMFKRHFAEE